MVTTSFYVGMARWRMSLDAITTLLVHRLEAQPTRIAAILTPSYGVTMRRRSMLWPQHLHVAQRGCCFWCDQPLPLSRATIEHVIPQGEDWWPQLTRMEQLLSLRLSHAICNRDYAAWRAARSVDELQRMDQQLVRGIRQNIHVHPILRVYSYHHPGSVTAASKPVIYVT